MKWFLKVGTDKKSQEEVITEKNSKSGSIRMFYEYQENWDRYFEIHIEKVEVECRN